MSVLHRIVVEVDEVASETQEDTEPFLNDVHALVHDASLVLVGTARL
jgi:hypothetical protein